MIIIIARVRFRNGGGGGGALGPIRNRKTSQNFHQNRKTGRKIDRKLKNPPKIMLKNHKFVVFNPSTLDTTAKYMALGTNQCPCYTAYSADSKRCSLSQRKFLQCSTKAVASSIAFASCEGETFAMNSGSFLQCANCWQELCRIIRLTQYFNTDHLRLMPRN